jgi:hypothetical protein
MCLIGPMILNNARLCVFLTFILGCVGLFAAPVPGFGSSALVSDPRHWHLRAHGIEFTAFEDWETIPGTWQELWDPQPPLKRLNWNYFHKNAPEMKFRLELIHSEKTDSLESWSKQWIRDYSSLGFDILGSRFFQQNGQRGLVIDTLHRKSSLKSRQVLFKKNSRVSILTCTAPKTVMEKYLEACNQLTKSFRFASQR